MILDLRKKKVNKQIKCPHCEIEHKPADIASTLKKGHFTCPACEGKIPAPSATTRKSTSPPSAVKKYLMPVLIMIGVVTAFAVSYFVMSAGKTTQAVKPAAPVTMQPRPEQPSAQPAPAPPVSSVPAVAADSDAQTDLPAKLPPDKMQTVERIAAEFQKNKMRAPEGDFVYRDMAISIWNQLMTNRIDAKIMAGNIRENISAWNYRQLVRECNDTWVVAKLSPTEKVAIETTAGTVIKPGRPGASAYFKGIEFDNPGQINRFDFLRKEANEICRDADRMTKDWNENVAGKQLPPREIAARQSRLEQKKQDCENAFTRLKEFESRAIFY